MQEQVPEKKLTYHQQWYKANKEKHLTYMKEKVHCDCGTSVARCQYARHTRSKKHQNWVASEGKTVTCSCGVAYPDGCRDNHMRSDQHQTFMKTQCNSQASGLC